MESDVVNPRVTVLMPVYDPPLDMLHASISSVLGQTFEDFEFLILNDGGRDEQVRTQLEFWASQDSRVRLFHEPHRGVPGTSNRGLELARGEYIARQDADDWSEPHRLAQQTAFLNAHPRIALAGSDAYLHAADGTPLWRQRKPHTPLEVSRALWRGNAFVHGSTLFRRAGALQVGGYREQLPYASDYDFLWRLTDAGEAMNLDEVLYHYRYTRGSISARKAADQARVSRAARILAATRRRGEAEDIEAALAAAGKRASTDTFRASLRQADHFMLAGDFLGARGAYLRLVHAQPWSGTAWAKLFRLKVFATIPWAREVSFR
jgi:glycosyltransferase involved in cell wall biosynthesis